MPSLLSQARHTIHSAGFSASDRPCASRSCPLIYLTHQVLNFSPRAGTLLRHTNDRAQSRGIVRCGSLGSADAIACGKSESPNGLAATDPKQDLVGKFSGSLD